MHGSTYNKPIAINTKELRKVFYVLFLYASSLCYLYTVLCFWKEWREGRGKKARGLSLPRNALSDWHGERERERKKKYAFLCYISTYTYCRLSYFTPSPPRPLTTWLPVAPVAVSREYDRVRRRLLATRRDVCEAMGLLLFLLLSCSHFGLV